MHTLLSALILTIALSGCASYEQFKQITQDLEIPSKVFKADFNQTWQAVIAVMRNYDISQQNQEAGFIKTRWMDNTLEKNFADSFGSNDSVKAAKFRLVVNVVKGYQLGREVSRVTVYKRQLVEQDFLQGWKEMRTDRTMEETLLYRVQRLIWIDNQLKEIDRIKEQEQIKNF